MKYYHEKTLKNVSFEEAIQRVTDALKEEGFGVLTEIDVQATLKKKLDEDIQPYRILGACNPSYAHKAILVEDKIGVMLPCNVIVQQKQEGVDVASVDPMVSMQAIENKDLVKIAEEIQLKLKKVIASL